MNRTRRRDHPTHPLSSFTDLIRFMENEHSQQNHGQHTPTPAAEQKPATPQDRRYVRPRADITETANGFVVQVELPGVQRQGLEVTFENGELTLTGHRVPTTIPAGGELLYRESRPSDFRRTFELDQSIDATGISAALDQGLLTLHLPKAEAAKPRRIEISGLN